MIGGGNLNAGTVFPFSPSFSVIYNATLMLYFVCGHNMCYINLGNSIEDPQPPPLLVFESLHDCAPSPFSLLH